MAGDFDAAFRTAESVGELANMSGGQAAVQIAKIQLASRRDLDTGTARMLIEKGFLPVHDQRDRSLESDMLTSSGFLSVISDEKFMKDNKRVRAGLLKPATEASIVLSFACVMAHFREVAEARPMFAKAVRLALKGKEGGSQADLLGEIAKGQARAGLVRDALATLGSIPTKRTEHCFEILKIFAEGRDKSAFRAVLTTCLENLVIAVQVCAMLAQMDQDQATAIAFALHRIEDYLGSE